MTELAAHERVRTPTTTVAIRRLEKLGLVKRSRDPSDLRAVLVDITPTRPGSAPGIAGRPPGAAGDAAGKLSHEDLETLTKALAPLERTRRIADQPSQSSTAAAVHDCCMLPSGSPVNGS